MYNLILRQKLLIKACSQIGILDTIKGIFGLKVIRARIQGSLYLIPHEIRVASAVVIMGMAQDHIVCRLNRSIHESGIVHCGGVRSAVKYQIQGICPHKHGQSVLCHKRLVLCPNIVQ